MSQPFSVIRAHVRRLTFHIFHLLVHLRRRCTFGVHGSQAFLGLTQRSDVFGVRQIDKKGYAVHGGPQVFYNDFKRAVFVNRIGLNRCMRTPSHFYQLINLDSKLIQSCTCNHVYPYIYIYIYIYTIITVYIHINIVVCYSDQCWRPVVATSGSHQWQPPVVATRCSHQWW